jgi:hypothetical protein
VGRKRVIDARWEIILADRYKITLLEPIRAIESASAYAATWASPCCVYSADRRTPRFRVWQIIASHLRPKRNCLTHLPVLIGRSGLWLRTDFISAPMAVSVEGEAVMSLSSKLSVVDYRIGRTKVFVPWSLLWIIWTVKRDPRTSHSAGRKTQGPREEVAVFEITVPCDEWRSKDCSYTENVAMR